MRNKISSFLLNSAKSKGLSDVFVAQTDPLKESLAGKIFVLAEFSSGKKTEWKKVFDFIISSLEDNYYNDEKLLLKDKIEGLKAENIFEASLTKTNLDLNDFLEEEKIKLNPSAVNLTVGLIIENRLHFSNFGKNRALLIYKQKTGYEMINVETNAFEKGEEEGLLEDGRAVPKTPKIFSSIISGEMPKNAFFVFTSESTPEYLSEKELINIISKLPPLTAASQIKNILEQINSFVPFFGMIIKSASEVEPDEFLEEAEEMPRLHRPISSLSHSLSRTEKQTEEMLSSSGLMTWNRLKSGLKNIANKKKEQSAKDLKLVKTHNNDNNDDQEEFEEEIREEEFGEDVEKEKEFEEEIKISAEENTAIKPEISLIKTVSIEKKFFRPKMPVIQTARFSGAGRKLSSFAKPFSFIPLFFKNAFSGLSGKKRLAISLFAGLFIILVASIWLTAINNRNKAIKEEFARLAEEIESKEAAISMRLLYDDVEGAKSILDEARQNLAKLPQKSNEQIAAYSALLNRLDAEQEKVYRLKRLNSLEMVFDLSGQAPFEIEFANDSLLAFSGNKAHSLNIKDNKSAEYPLKNNYSEYSAQYDGKNTIYLLQGNKLAKFNTGNGQENITEIKGLEENSHYNAFSIYATNRLYLLDSNKNEIISRNGASYANASSWLKEQADLSQAKSLFVNGSIFILNANGQVEKYYVGKKESYGSAALEPKLGDFQKMSGSASKLYLFDPSGKRLAVIDIEKGTLSAQYVFESAQEAKDFAIDEKNNQIYLLDGEKIYRYKME